MSALTLQCWIKAGNREVFPGKVQGEDVFFANLSGDLGQIYSSQHLGLSNNDLGLGFDFASLELISALSILVF